MKDCVRVAGDCLGGDVPRMRLSIEKLSALGYEPDMSSDEGVERATAEMLEERT